MIMIINPRRACAARVTVVVLCVCLSVCLSVCLFTTILGLQATRRHILDFTPSPDIGTLEYEYNAQL